MSRRRDRRTAPRLGLGEEELLEELERVRGGSHAVADGSLVGEDLVVVPAGVGLRGNAGVSEGLRAGRCN